MKYTPPLSILILVALLACLDLLAGCANTKNMGQSCTSSEQCMGDGNCLQGVCSGYACESDAQCSGGLVCGTILDIPTCVTECSSDGDCGGEQTCTSVAETTEQDSPYNDYCLCGAWRQRRLRWAGCCTVRSHCLR